MTLEKLYQSQVLSQRTLDVADIRYLYQPFGELTPRHGPKPETRIREALERGKVAMVADDTGTGKSSLANYVLSELSSDYFPIVYRVSYSGDIEKVCSDQTEFVRYVLDQTLQSVKQVAKIRPADKERYRRYLAQEITYTKGNKDAVVGRLKNKFSWLPGLVSTEADIGAELEDHLQVSLQEKVYAVDRIAAIEELCRVIEAKGKRPILVFEDTDHFLQQGRIDRTGLIDPFFVDIVSMFSDFGCGVLLLAHSTYESYETFRNAKRKHFDEVVNLPVVDFAGFSKILTKKISAIAEHKTAADVFESNALRDIFQRAYQPNSYERLRYPMRIAQVALEAAVRYGALKVTVENTSHALLDEMR